MSRKGFTPLEKVNPFRNRISNGARKSSLAGFTLVELILVIVTVGIIAAVLTPFISSAVDSWFFTSTEREIVFSARLAMNRMVREIRQIKNTASITTFTSTAFTFQDINDTNINFQQTGSSLERNSYELTGKLQDPGGLEFTYLDSDGNSTETSDDIRMVRIKLILLLGDNSITIQSLARFRNVS